MCCWHYELVPAEQRKRIINPCFKGGHKHVAACHRNKEKRSGEALWLRDPTAENGKSIYGAILFPARPLAANAHITDAEGERLR